MPNWCEGSLKVRGSTKNIVRWISEGLNKYEGKINPETKDYEDSVLDKSTWLNICKEDPGFVGISLDSPDIYVEGTKRAFINSYMTWSLPEDSEKEVVYFELRQAWAIRPEEFVKIARDYDLDLYLYGIEQGCGFVCSYQILDHGQTVIDESKTFNSYDDYLWNCPLPWLGG